MNNDWQPIDTAPKPGTPVLITGFIRNEPKNGRWVTMATQDEEYLEWWLSLEGDFDGECFYPPTHWMPLPDPPTE